MDDAQLTHLAEQVVGADARRQAGGAGHQRRHPRRAGRASGLHDRSLDLPARQAAAAVGQIELMWRYREIFGQFGPRIAQVLLTQLELSDFRRYLHLRNTLSTLLGEYGVVPVLNENDSVSAEGVQIGENDRLAAVVASKLEADVLLSLSDVAGYYDGDPHHDPEAAARSRWCGRSPPEMEQARRRTPPGWPGAGACAPRWRPRSWR